MKRQSRAYPAMGVVMLVVLAAIAMAYGFSRLRTTPSRSEIAAMAAAIKSKRSDLPTFPPPRRPPMGKSGREPGETR